ncbi:sensor histidine kinase [Streptomyces spongiae]|uniref:histidine kinase n=1 Tax=Streptomyces spongiae TaxID=565072 RepID=A0A5N8XBP6_9ACTN|nr:HAMP domain-containing sensor histidine kinase [Streptomyces spongiae]MPY56328.1 HAMP domain-containing histidine kinase [Streptomyces spongiae]
MRKFLLRPATSLRRRLVVGVTVLATLAVLTSQAIGSVVLRSWLLDRVDQQLAAFHPPAPVYADALRDDLPGPRTRPSVLPSDFRVYFYDSTGERLNHSMGAGRKSAPLLADSSDDLGMDYGRPETISAEDGDGSWRVVRYAGPDGMNAVVALPLDTVDDTLSRLLWLDAAVLGVAVAALIAVGRWVVRLGLLPLTRMERTAEDITAGDLDLRLTDTDARTEIGRLGRVLNTMLDRLQRALQEREASEARMRRFVADAGHELRTPLTAIQGYAELALRPERRSAGERQEADRVVAQNAERMSLLVDDLQLLASLDKEPSYRHEPVDLLSLAADAVSTAALQDTTHPVDLGPVRPPEGSAGTSELELVETMGDPHRLRQIVENLLSNARIHTPPGTAVHVRVGTARSGAAGGSGRPGRTSASPSLSEDTAVSIVEVSDEGPGLTAHDAAHVFERFYRADPSRSRARGGSGLGLAIASTIAEGHGGRLELDTAPGEGCTFRLVLPGEMIKPSAAPEQGARPSPGRSGGWGP